MEETTERDEPLTPAGRLFLQPQMDQVINAAVAVESAIDADAFKAVIESSVLLKNPRFCSLMVRDSGGREYWRRTPVDINRHVIVRHQPLSDDPSVSDEDVVNEFLADLTFSSPLPIDKPLWEIHLLMAHKTIVFRVHHALGDGISLMSMVLSCCRRVEDPTLPPAIGGVGQSSVVQRRRFSVWKLVMMVWYTLVYVVEFVLRLVWLRDKITSVSGGAGVELWPRKLATARFQLEDMKIVKRAVANATINDVLFGIISHGLSRYFDIRSSNSKGLPEGLRITGLAMVNLRPQQGLQDVMNIKWGSRWGNKFGMLLLPVYYQRDGSDPIQFVKRAKDMIDKKKLSLEAPFSYGFGKSVMYLFGAKIASMCTYRLLCNTTFTVSNVIGPREEITIAGSHVTRIRATSSSLPHAITMHMVSYGSAADLQILVAKEIIPDPKVLAKCFEDALLQLKVAAAAAAEATTKT